METKEFAKNIESLSANEKLADVLIKGLLSTYQLHKDLGSKGVSQTQKNQFGETALTMDVEAEEIMLDALKKTQIPLKVFSEEHGEIVIGDHPEYTVTLDGLDGSAEYRERREKAMYGTMISVMKGINPQYKDYVACGIMIHSPEPKLFLALKDTGCFEIDIKTGEKKQLQNRQNNLSSQSIIDLDTNWGPYKNLFASWKGDFPNLQCAYFSQAARTALFLEGKVDAMLEWTRKGNLEQPVTYGLVKELGGIVTTIDGEDLGSKYFATFEQKESVPLIIARNKQYADELSKQLSLKSIFSRGSGN